MTSYSSVKNNSFYVSLLFLTAGLIASCGSGDKDGTDLNTGGRTESQMGFETFEKTIFPYARENCAGCHGRDRTPLFAVEDAKKAYEAARTKINFADYENSVFIFRTTNRHCGEPCATDGSFMERMLAAWSQAELSGLESPPVKPAEPIENRIELKAQFLPGDMKIGSLYQIMEWDIPLGDSKIEIEVQRFSKDAVQFRRPRVASSDTNLRIQDVRLTLDGVRIKKTRFNFIDKVISLRSMEKGDVLTTDRFPVLSTESEIHLVDQSRKSDENGVVVSFKVLEKADSGQNCKSSELFEENVMSTMKNRNCFACHAVGSDGKGGNPRAKRRFNMALSKDQLCAEALQRVDLNRPFLSPLIWYPRGAPGIHPEILPFTEEVLPSWIDWIEAEKKAHSDALSSNELN